MLLAYFIIAEDSGNGNPKVLNYLHPLCDGMKTDEIKESVELESQYPYNYLWEPNNRNDVTSWRLYVIAESFERALEIAQEYMDKEVYPKYTKYVRNPYKRKWVRYICNHNCNCREGYHFKYPYM